MIPHSIIGVVLHVVFFSLLGTPRDALSLEFTRHARKKKTPPSSLALEDDDDDDEEEDEEKERCVVRRIEQWEK